MKPLRSKFVQFAALLALIVPVLTIVLTSPVAAGQPPCTTRPDNLTRNGSVTDGGYDTQYGTVANEWNPFIYGESAPAYDLADNESANGDIAGSSSQYIHGDGVQFDAGIYQTIIGVQPGAYYEFSVGWAAMLRDIGGGQNKKIDGAIMRLVGADPTGGTDPHSSNVIWGPELTNGGSGISLNNPNMRLTFAAQSDHVTVFVRAYDRDSAPSDKVFLDVICLVPRGDLPTVTPNATATNSPTPTKTFTPTNEPRVEAQAAPQQVRVVDEPPTKTPKPTNTPTLVPTHTPTVTNTPTVTPTRTETPRPYRAIPLTSGSTGGGDSRDVAMRTEAATTSNNSLILAGLVLLIGLSLLGIIGLGGFVVLRVLSRGPAAGQANYTR